MKKRTIGETSAEATESSTTARLDSIGKTISRIEGMLRAESGNNFDVNAADVALERIISSRPDISPSEEDALVDAALDGHRDVLLLAKHFKKSGDFLRHARRRGLLSSPTEATERKVLVVGAGLAGLTAAISLADEGVKVVLLEKSGHFGGNSAYASSGLNAVSPSAKDPDWKDTPATYLDDTLRSSGGSKTASKLIPILTENSFSALEWIRHRTGLGLELRGQLGGHSFARTWRPSDGLAGSEIIVAMQRQARKLEKDGKLEIMLKTTATTLLRNAKGHTDGVIATATKSGAELKLNGFEAVVLATGGYANDRTSSSLLERFRPDLVQLASTNFPGATGDGHKLAMEAGAQTVDMDHVQVHPTAFIDGKKPSARRKTLCAEILRGVGGILLDSITGSRFANELGKRDYLVDRMRKAARGTPNEGNMSFVILLNSAAARAANKHVPIYAKKGLLHKMETVDDLSLWMGLPVDTLQATFVKYDNSSHGNVPDEFGRKDFGDERYTSGGPFYAGLVTPALHYTMGGLAIDGEGRAQKADGSGSLPGLWVAGEATGGIHGVNRLGGNALTECAVFGRVVAKSILSTWPDSERRTASTQQQQQQQQQQSAPPAAKDATKSTERIISIEELKQHNTESSAWVAIDGKVYDLTDFLEEHPAGPESILETAGRDGTEIFRSVHSPAMLEEFESIGQMKIG